MNNGKALNLISFLCGSTLKSSALKVTSFRFGLACLFLVCSHLSRKEHNGTCAIVYIWPSSRLEERKQTLIYKKNGTPLAKWWGGCIHRIELWNKISKKKASKDKPKADEWWIARVAINNNFRAVCVAFFRAPLHFGTLYLRDPFLNVQRCALCHRLSKAMMAHSSNTQQNNKNHSNGWCVCVRASAKKAEKNMHNAFDQNLLG